MRIGEKKGIDDIRLVYDATKSSLNDSVCDMGEISLSHMLKPLVQFHAEVAFSKVFADESTLAGDKLTCRWERIIIGFSNYMSKDMFIVEKR